jgi:DNA-binding MarR family transcriptional regulator
MPSPPAAGASHAHADRERALADPLERIVIAGVALTTRALAEAAQGFDLSFPQWRVMVVLGEDEAGATISQVASRVGVTVPATSRQLKRLQHRGLVEVGQDPNDRRATRARLSSLGNEVRQAILAHRRERLLESVESLPGDGVTFDELDRIATALEPYR